MKANIIPDELYSALPHDEYIPYSFDVTSDGEKGLVTLCTEDRDFPEVWVYEQRNNIATRIDNDLFIDWPISKVFWAENDKDIIIASYDTPPSLSEIIISNVSGLCEEEGELQNNSEYIHNKLEEILDFSRTNRLEKCELSNDVIENKHKYCLDLFVEKINADIDMQRRVCRMGDDVKNWDQSRYLYGQIVSVLNKSLKESGIKSQEIKLNPDLSGLEMPPFKPEVGECYKISWGWLTHQGQEGVWSTCIRVEGIEPNQWFDLESNEPIEPEWAMRKIKYYNKIKC